MISKLKKLFNILSQPKGQRFLIIALPCFTLALCALLVIPQIRVLLRHTEQRDIPNVTPAPVAETARPLPSPEVKTIPLELRAASSVGDLLIYILDESGQRVSGVNFELNLSSPEGETNGYFSADDGSCYIIGLDPGLYSVSLRPQQGYIAEESIVATVRSHVEYAQISPRSGLLGITQNNWALGQSKDIAEMLISAPESAAPYGWSEESGGVYFYDNSGNVVTGLAAIDGKLCFFNEFGQKAKAFGIDVSYYNGTVDWKLIVEQGVDFVMVRMGGRGWSSGLVYDDASASEFIRSAKAAGLDVGVYFYSTAVSPAESVAEAENIISRLRSTELDYPIYLDLEYSGQYPGGRADRLSRQERTDIIRAFCGTVLNRGYEAGIYAGQYYIETALDYEQISMYSIWLANYSENYNLPSFHGSYDIWQFTDRGQIDGIIGPVDLNVIF